MYLLNEVWRCDSMDLLVKLPTASVHAVVSDPMYGVSTGPKPCCVYDWGYEGYGGSVEKWWYGGKGLLAHRDYYRECLRVLKPGGRLVWGVGMKFHDPPRYDLFGKYRLWATCNYYRYSTTRTSGHCWLAQTREQVALAPPDTDGLIVVRRRPTWQRCHPCAKPPEEMEWLVRAVTRPGETVLDPFAGVGTTCLVCKRTGRNYIGAERSPLYAGVARWALKNV
jgi:DNA modification methylase